MRRTLSAFLISSAAFITPAIAQDMNSGSRVTVESDWHDRNGGPYSPKVVPCNSNSGMCLRDTRSSPANTPMIKTTNGLQVIYKSQGVVYLFRSGGKGTFHDMSGKQIGTFSWSQ